MKASEKAYSLIRQFEGLRLTAYRCPAGVWTVGYGHTSGVVPGMVITKEKAEDFLKRDIAMIENIVNAECMNLRQCQFDALVSFVFNVGGGNFRKSTLLKKIKANPDDNSIMDESLRWVYAKGVVLSGLQKRRLADITSVNSEIVAVRKENEELKASVDRLYTENSQLKDEVRQLREQVAKARR